MQFVIVNIPVERHEWQNPKNKPWYQYFEDSAHEKQAKLNEERSNDYKGTSHDDGKILCQCGCERKDIELISAKRKAPASDRDTSGDYGGKDSWRKKLVLSSGCSRNGYSPWSTSRPYKFANSSRTTSDFSWSKTPEGGTSGESNDNTRKEGGSRDHNKDGDGQQQQQPENHVTPSTCTNEVDC